MNSWCRTNTGKTIFKEAVRGKKKPMVIKIHRAEKDLVGQFYRACGNLGV